MPVRREGQLEKCIDDATKKGDFHSLEQFLETSAFDSISHKCSKQFINKLDRLVCQRLENEEIKKISILLNVIQKHGKNINILGEGGFPAMIKYDLIQKIKEILESRISEKNDNFTTVIEDFFDVLMTVHDASSEGKMQILENFILRTCALTADSRINIYIRQEAVRKLNSMLDAMPRDIRKKIISTKEMLHVMNEMGKRVLDAGDYDFQVAITEALCRMTSEKQRGELASQWFSMEFVTNAFKGIKDSEFETDCRKFLNQVNGMLGDKRRVFTYPCLSAFLGEYELQIPEDDNLEAFWIDFNTGSRSISFYVAADDEAHHWETVSIPEEEVETYAVEEEKDKKKLTINIKNPIFVGDEEGEKILLNFDSALEILEAVRKVYGANKCQGFTKKNTMSVARTTVHVIFDESGSQVLVPESQISPLKDKSYKPVEEKCSYPVKPHFLPNLNKEVNMDCPQFKITPGKRKVSEASMTVPCTTRLPGQSPFQLVTTSSPRKGRAKVPLQMMNSAEKTDASSVLERRAMNVSLVEDSLPVSPVSKSLQKKKIATQKHIPVKKGIQVFHSEENFDTCKKQPLDELNDIVPDSQPVDRNEKSLLPGLLENSTVEIKSQKKQMCWVPEKSISHCNRQNRSVSESITLTESIHQASNLSDRVAKHRAFSSVFEITSPTLRNNQCCSEEITEQKQNQTNKLPVISSKTNSPESQSDFKHLEEEISTNVRSKIVSSKPRISLNACRKTGSSVVNSELVKEANDEVVFDASSFGKETASKKAEQRAKSKPVVEATDILISTISDRYKQVDGTKSTRKLYQSFSHSRASLNKSGVSLSKKKSQNRGSKNLQSETVLNITTGHMMDDVYNFNLSGFDEPTIKLGIQEFHVTKFKATASISKNRNHEDEEKNSTQKKQDKKKGTSKNKKHLFSDTDTEHRGDDTKTDISWLQESSRKPKPQLVDYSRPKNQMKSKTLGTSKSLMSTSIKNVSHQKKGKSSKSENDAARNPPPTRLRQPRRAAKAKKCYKELSDTETESEGASSPPLIKKDLVKRHPENRSINNKDVNQLKVKQCFVSSGVTKGQSIKQTKNGSVKSNDSSSKNEMELSPNPSSDSPGSVELMRYSEKAAEEDSIHEHVSVRRSSSSFLQDLTPEKEETICNIKEITALFHTNKESGPLNQHFEKSKKSVFEDENLSPALSPLSMPKLTPLTTDKTFPAVQNSEAVEFEDKMSSADEAISIKNDPLDRSFDTELKEFSERFTNNRRKSCASPSRISTPRSNREKRWHEESVAQLHESGPTLYPKFKRTYHHDTESDSDEVEIRREEERKTKLLPRKLFKVDDSTRKVSESISTLSINDTSVLDGEGWDADSSSARLISQKLHKEFARKIQNRSNRMDGFTKQSLKSVHQHMSTMSSELQQHRTNQLEQFHSCLIDELESFEKDAQALKNAEKEFSNFSKKHTHTFSSYNKNEQQRLQALKTSFEKNVCRAADCEENIFSSEMHLMKEDMKALQEKLLKEMQDEELLNIRKGLQSLFMIEERKF